MQRVKGVKYTVTEGDWAWSAEHTMQYTGNGWQNCTLETYRPLLTNATPVNLIKKKKLSLFIHSFLMEKGSKHIPGRKINK